MSGLCSDCFYLTKRIWSEDNDKTDEWLNCDLFYVETRDAPTVEDFGCNHFLSLDDGWKREERGNGKV